MNARDDAQRNFRQVSAMRLSFQTKPILGGWLGRLCLHLGEYRHRYNGPTTYLVVDPVSRLPIADGETKAEALGRARHAMAWPGLEDYLDEGRKLAAEQQAFIEEMVRGGERLAESPKPRAVPRRRRAIFDASEGKCHYCGIALTLDGKWHIEHKMPRALMGTDDPLNLVASCALCNLKKHDRTDVEFKHERARAAA